MTTNFLRLTILGALSVSLLVGQSDVARIVGTVSDASGAVIPAASVLITSERTAETRKVTSNEQGRYMAAQLPPVLSAVWPLAGFLVPRLRSRATTLRSLCMSLRRHRAATGPAASRCGTAIVAPTCVRACRSATKTVA